MVLPSLSSLLLILLSSSVLLHHTSRALPLPQDLQLKSKGKEETPLGRPHTKIFHPPTNSCIWRKSFGEPPKLGPCAESDTWYYTPQKLLKVQGSYFCLQAVGSGKPVRFSVICNPTDSQWKIDESDQHGKITKTRLSTQLQDGTTLCLDSDSAHTITSNPCGTSDATADSQWFKMVTDYPKITSL